MDKWKRHNPNEGGGITCVLQDGRTFEKAGVNITVMNASLSKELQASMRARCVCVCFIFLRVMLVLSRLQLAFEIVTIFCITYLIIIISASDTLHHCFLFIISTTMKKKKNGLSYIYYIFFTTDYLIFLKKKKKHYSLSPATEGRHYPRTRVSPSLLQGSAQSSTRGTHTCQPSTSTTATLRCRTKMAITNMYVERERERERK